MNFCNQCGARVELRVPPGDHLPRHICSSCGTIHYQNPRLVVGCVPEHDGRILICANAPSSRGSASGPCRRGSWRTARPCSRPPPGSRTRKPWQRSSIGSLLSVVHVLHAHQVHVFFRASLPKAEFAAGPESLEVKLVRPEEIPWDGDRLPQHRFHACGDIWRTAMPAASSIISSAGTEARSTAACRRSRMIQAAEHSRNIA